MAVLDLFTLFPERAVKMSDIVRATKINHASCHSVVNVLAKHGYLIRTPERTYVLGPALIPLGHAAAKAHPSIDRAETAAKDLFEALHIPVILTTLIEDDVLILSTVADRRSRPVNLRAGQRQPAVAPLGAHLVAWSSEDVIEAWIAKAGIDDNALADTWRRSLALMRERGFRIVLDEPEYATYGEMVAQMAAAARPADDRDKTLHFLSLHRMMNFTEPEVILENEIYDVVSICAPIFSQGAEPKLSLCLTAFPNKLTGAQINEYADHLLRACLRVMREPGAL